MSDIKPLVLVTGGTGFLAKWVLAKLLLSSTYRIRTTLRTPSREPEIKSSLAEAGVPGSAIQNLHFAVTDLLHDTNWADAMTDVTYVLHIASPFPSEVPKDENEIITPAVEGTKRVLRFAKEAGVKRVVVTSSVAAIAWGHAKTKTVFTEEDWTDLSSGVNVGAYMKSKTLAEKAAWDVMQTYKEEGSIMEMVSINPVNIYGPALGKEDGTSLRAISELLSGNAPGIPRVQWGVVDVRDCADLHILAMTHEKAAGERFICIGEGALWMGDIAKILKEKLGEKAKKVPTMGLPDFVVKLVALVMPVAKMIVPDLGVEREMSCGKARERLGWQWRYSSEQAVVSGAESLIRFGF
ncbi:hypothetical protein BDW66DRAFT_146443 [Aspergillus desertorum]